LSPRMPCATWAFLNPPAAWPATPRRN
jgi:hypothetical protein